MAEGAFTITCVAAGTGICSVIASILPATSPELILLFAASGSVIGATTGCIRPVFQGSRQKKTRSSTAFLHSTENQPRSAPRSQSVQRIDAKKRSVHKPTPFRKRLSNFTGQDEHEVMMDRARYRSSMPFWSIANLLSRVPPKSASLIRSYLLRIHVLSRKGRS